MPCDLADLVNQLLSLTEILASALTKGDWLEAERIEAERMATLENISSALSVNGHLEASSVLELMVTVQGLNKTLLDNLMREKDQVARELLHLNSAAHAERAYRSHYEDTE